MSDIQVFLVYFVPYDVKCTFNLINHFQSKINIQCLSNTSKNSQVVTLSWYDGKNGHVGPDAPTLVICYDNGRMQIMKHESDDGKFKVAI